MATTYFSTQVISRDVLPLASPEELLALTRVFDEQAQDPQSPEELAAKVCAAGGHAIGNLLRGQGVPYTELLHDVAETLKVESIQPLDSLTDTGLTVCEMDERALNAVVAPNVKDSWVSALNDDMRRHEDEILKKFIVDSYERMPAAQRAEVDRKVVELAKQLPGSGIAGLTSTAAILVVANAGGFATYMLMSTVISTLTFGLASFGVFTAASSVLSVLIGPVGWTTLGIAAVYKLGGPNQQQCVKAVLAIAMVRGRLDQPAHALPPK